MKPLYLSIQGINSFTDKQEIFFDRLSTGGLFCICGPTGSGKTTILDSIILALYGKGGRGRIGDYINLSAASGEIVFEFSSENSVYRIERTFFKDANKPSKCLVSDKTAGKILADTVSAADQKLKAIIGLLREEFTQVALIEQGKFSEFLSADKSSRNATVGNLFRLDRFKNLYEKFNSRRSAINGVKETLVEQCKEFSQISDELIVLKQSSLEKTKQDLLATQTKLTDLSAQIQIQQQIKVQWESVNKAKEKLDCAERKGKEIAAEISKLEKKLNDIDVYAGEAALRKKNAENARLLLGVLDGLKHSYTLKSSAQEKLKTLISRLEKADQDILSAEKKIEGFKQSLLKSQNRVQESLQTAQEIYSFTLPKLEPCDYSKLISYIIELRQSVGGVLEQQKRLTSEISGIIEGSNGLQKDIETQQRIWDESKREQNRLNDEVEKLQSEIALLRTELRRAQIDNSASYIRFNLSVGEVCPVCGGKVSNEPMTSEACEASVIEEKLIAAEKSLEESRKTLTKVQGVLAAACTKIDSFGAQLSKQEESKKAAQKALDLLLKDVLKREKLCLLVGLLDGIKTDFMEIDRLLKAISEQKNQRAAQITAKEQTAADIKQTQSEISQITKAINEKTAGEDLFIMQARLVRQASADDDFVVRFEKGRQQTESAIRETVNQNASLQGEIKSLKETADKSISFDEQEYKALQSEQKALDENKSKLSRDNISLDYEIKDLLSKLEKKKKLESEINELNKKTDKLSLILKIVKGDRFLEYVAEEYIHRFTCEASNILSKISSGKYTLEYIDGIFYVCDFLMANELRRASTLSGGETFLASLSLAIAITAEISGYKSFEFFFLDEGFGTLDANSIEIVYEAIETLSKETLVGIVTHRSELVDKIQNRITLLPATEGVGSRVSNT